MVIALRQMPTQVAGMIKDALNVCPSPSFGYAQNGEKNWKSYT